MNLKSTVDGILKKHNRRFVWLAAEMNRTFDGLKLSLTTGSIKYRDIERMANLLEVPAQTFFSEASAPLADPTGKSIQKQVTPEHSELKQALKSCKELNAALRDQIKDKDKIIALLSKN